MVMIIETKIVVSFSFNYFYKITGILRARLKFGLCHHLNILLELKILNRIILMQSGLG